MEKKDYFNKEYNYVKDTNKRNDLILLVSGLPDYFFEIPASTHNSAIISDGVLFESIPNISFISKI